MTIPKMMIVHFRLRMEERPDEVILLSVILKS